MDKNKRISIWLPVIIAASIALGIFIGNYYWLSNQGRKRNFLAGNKIDAILDIILAHAAHHISDCSFQFSIIAIVLQHSLRVVQSFRKIGALIAGTENAVNTAAATSSQHADCQDAGQRQGKNAFEFHWTFLPPLEDKFAWGYLFRVLDLAG